MPKNVTVAVPDDLANEMETLPEVNWSEVARTAFKRYITLRRHPDISSILEFLEKQKGEEYVNGRIFAEELVKKIGYREFNLLLQEYGERVDKERNIFNIARVLPSSRILSNEEIMIQLLREREYIAEASESFSSGLIDRLLEINRTLG